MPTHRIPLSFLPLVVFSVSLAARAADPDPYLWLEDRESPRAMEWVRAHNDRTLPALEKDRRYSQIERDVRSILLATDRIPTPSYEDGRVYNFWQDKDHVRGLWRRTTLDEYAKAEPKWEILVDLDELARRENENWVWKGADCLPTSHDRCMLSLSRGGGDAVVLREYDLKHRKFPADGFVLPEAKSESSWLDRDRLLIGTDFGPGSKTDSGYPMWIKLWKRGTPLSSATLIAQGKPSDVSLWPLTAFLPDKKRHAIIVQRVTFYTGRYLALDPATLKLTPLEVPEDARIRGVFRDRALFQLRKDWKQGDRPALPAGSLISLPLGSKDSGASLVFAPESRQSVNDVQITRNSVYVSLLDNVQGRVFRFTLDKAGWKRTPVGFPDAGSITLLPADPLGDPVLAQYEGFVDPPTVFSVSSGSKPGAAIKKLRSLPPRFDGSRFEARQYESTSKDGTRIPYFVVQSKNLPLDGNQPTLLYGYGGFEIPMEPTYLGSTGKVWLEGGGVYVLANIRGGGEFGPAWHESAILKNRQKAYDDFISVAEDLISRKITSPKRLGIMGGSNGGLLVGASFVERPDLFGAVVCQVPLLDMVRYHKLPPGASWMAEYGNPDDPEMAPVIRAYSPYQNVKKGVAYPRVFFVTSTKDDRVNPAHARKMAARLEELGQSLEYFENTEGGHGGSANLEQRIHVNSLQFTYLFRQLSSSN